VGVVENKVDITAVVQIEPVNGPDLAIMGNIQVLSSGIQTAPAEILEGVVNPVLRMDQRGSKKETAQNPGDRVKLGEYHYPFLKFPFKHMKELFRLGSRSVQA